MIPQVALVLMMLAFVASSLPASDFTETDRGSILGMLLLICLPAIVGKLACLLYFRFCHEVKAHEESLDRFWGRLVLWQFVIWVLSSYSVLVVFNWPEWVKSYFPQGNFPPVREILYLLPALAAWFLAVSWGQSRCHRAIHSPASESRKDRSIRKNLRLWLAFMGVPLAVMSITHQIVPMLTQIPLVLQVLLGFIGSSVLILLVPKLILRLAFEKTKLDSNFSSRMDKLLGSRLAGETEFFIWNTEREICNAMCFKSWRGRRQVIFSDLMVEYFSASELDAVARHELAHLDRGHAGWRFLALSFPLTLVFGLESLGFLSLFRLESSPRMMVNFTMPGVVAIGVTAIVSVLFFGWVSRLCEYDADYRAVNSVEVPGSNFEIAVALIGVLQKMMVAMPEQGDRAWGCHPSLKSRISRIEMLMLKRLGADVETRVS